MRKLSLKGLRKQAWKLESKYVRCYTADEHGFVHCFTCDKVYHWKQMDCGHFIHKDCLDFEITNLAPQCTYCNRYQHGNLAIYAVRMVKKYGLKRVEELQRLASIPKKFTREELEKILDKYERKLNDLQNF